MTIQTKLYTADEFWDYCASLPDGKRAELVRGEIVEMAAAGGEHGVLALWLGARMVVSVDAHDLGKVLGTDTGFVLSTNPDVVREPDIAFLSKARLATTPVTPEFPRGAPDLAVEIISPGDTASEVQEKVAEYFAAGVRLVWAVYPRNKTVNVHYPNGITRRLDIDDALDGEDVIPGFQLPLRDLFKPIES